MNGKFTYRYAIFDCHFRGTRSLVSPGRSQYAMSSTRGEHFFSTGVFALRWCSARAGNEKFFRMYKGHLVSPQEYLDLWKAESCEDELKLLEKIYQEKLNEHRMEYGNDEEVR